MNRSRKLLAMAMAGCMAMSVPGVSMAQSQEFTPNAPYEFMKSETPIDERIDEIISELTLEEKIELAQGSAAINRLGLNSMRSGGGEGLHGVDDRKIATVFPSSIALSQSWDKQLLYDFGEVVAEESLADNGSATRLAPVLDLLHDPRYGRSYETYGEDSYLSGTLGDSATAGMNQRTEDGYMQFIPRLKHPMPYNAEINRLWTNIVMSPRNFYEYYSRSFKYPVSSGNAKSLMNTYQMVNGVPFSVSPIQSELMNEWTPDYEGTGHYEYTTVNDYGSGSSMFVHSQRYFADNPLERAYGVAAGTKNGQMSWSFRSYGSGNGGNNGGASGPLRDAYVRGMLTEEDFEENARRSLALALRMGDLDQLGIESPYLVPGAQTSQDRDEVVKENREVAFRASQEQIVMLKNDGILPLDGDTTDQAVLLGPLSDQILNDHYTGARLYSVTIKDALENKLGKENVAFDRAIDTIAIRAANGKYLVNSDNPVYRQAGTSYEEDVPVMATGEDDEVTMDDTALLFERYDYGSTYNLLRTVINNQYVQITPFATGDNNSYSVTMVNNTSAPGEANRQTGETAYVNYQTFRIVPTTDGKYGLYNLIAGNGSNGGTGKAYDADDEDTNNGSYVMVTEDGHLVADLSTIGPYRNEEHTDGASVYDSKVDTDATDEAIDGLSEQSKFEIETVRSSEQAIDETIAKADEDAPIILVVGYEPHLNSREAIDLYHTGLSDQQMRMIDHVTKDLGRDVILIVKTGNAMTIDEEVASNEKVRAISEIGHTGQEEGSALVSTLFDDGYSVPEEGFAPALPDHNTGDTPEAFTEYPGYLENEEEGTISPESPAGRLSATWYKEISDMIGASEDHAPASYAWPAYDEETNDNLSNINGSINTGLMTFDIIKGERTYQYFNGDPLYAFGYGLTYGDFAYSDVQLSEVEDGKVTVSGQVTNNGEYASDEVVQVYSSFEGEESRIDQANQRLVAYDRLQDIEPGETRSFSFEIDIADTMSVFDVETQEGIVEPGNYTIRVVPSSDTEAADNNSATLVMTEENGAKKAAVRDLTQVKMAVDYDDYSMISEQLDDIETVSASIAYGSDTAVSFRKNGAWIQFKDVTFTEAPAVFTALVGADREGSLKIYALEAGSDPSELENAQPVAVIPLTDTRSIQGLPTGLGIGPVGVNPGTPEGQEYADAYVKPEWTKVCADVTMEAGNYDVYIQTENRGSRIDWFKFGQAADQTEEITVTQLLGLDSIRTAGGELELMADVVPISAVDEVTWSVAGEDGAATDLASIDENGLLTANGTGNGTVIVTAEANGKTASKEILITNQLEENKVDVEGAAKTVEYIMITTEGRFGQTDNIMRYKGTNQQTVIFNELFEENPDQYYLPGTYLTVTADQIEWSLTDEEGNPTDLAVLDENGLLTANGTGNGKVVVHAVLKSNPDIRADRTIVLQNQEPKDAFTMIQAEHFDEVEGMEAPASITAFGKNGNELGLVTEIGISEETPSASMTYRQIDFGEGAQKLYLRLAAEEGNTQISLLIDGSEVAAAADIGTGNIYHYDTIELSFEGISGVHDVTLSFSGAPARLNWFQLE